MPGVTAQIALKTALRDIVGPAAREQGFKGSAPTWRKSNADGDWAVVNVQSSSSSSAAHLRCIINLAVAPAPWLAWERSRLGPGAPKSIDEAMGLFRDRLHPSGPAEGVGRWWDVYDEASARAVADDMVAQLTARAWPVLQRLLDRKAFLEQLVTGELGGMRRANFEVFFARAEALLLMDAGPSEQLNRALRVALDGFTPRDEQAARDFDSWVRERASRVIPE